MDTWLPNMVASSGTARQLLAALRAGLTAHICQQSTHTPHCAGRPPTARRCEAEADL